VTEPSVVGAFVRAALANYRESKQHGNEWKHSILTQR
jgi:ABC-type taurine transport system substrate-binding protein